MQRKSIGQRVSVPSSLTGAVLDYFVPFPLTEVAAGFPVDSQKMRVLAPDDLASILPLLPILAAARTDRSQTDPILLALHIQVATGARSILSSTDLIELGSEINGRSAGLRRQVVFSGGPIPSNARVIYPPPSELPALVESMGQFLGTDLSGWSPSDLPVLVCEYAIRVHPFNDGNGRWARLLALDAGRRTGSLWAGACAALINQQRGRSEAGRSQFADTTSLESYWQANREFSDELHQWMRDANIFEQTSNLWNLAREYTLSGARAIELAVTTLTTPTLAPAVLSKRFGWSSRKSAQYIESTLDGAASNSSSSANGMGITSLVARTRQAIESIVP